MLSYMASNVIQHSMFHDLILKFFFIYFNRCQYYILTSLQIDHLAGYSISSTNTIEITHFPLTHWYWKKMVFFQNYNILVLLCWVSSRAFPQNKYSDRFVKSIQRWLFKMCPSNAWSDALSPSWANVDHDILTYSYINCGQCVKAAIIHILFKIQLNIFMRNFSPMRVGCG